SLPELVDPRDVAAAGGVELFAPSPQLSFQEAFGSAEVGEPHRDVVDGVQFGQGVDHRLGDAACPFGAQRDELVPMPVGGAFDVVHHVEGCAEHGGVVAQQHGGRYGDRGGGEGADDGVLAAHVVRGGQYMAQWWTADHPAVGAVVDDVGEVRPTSFDHPAAQGTGEQPRPFPLEVGAQPVQIEARR